MSERKGATHITVTLRLSERVTYLRKAMVPRTIVYAPINLSFAKNLFLSEFKVSLNIILLKKKKNLMVILQYASLQK